MQKRQILDNIIFIQEAVHTRKRGREKGMIIKIDMANPFDRVCHAFLFDVLHRFGFIERVIHWIRACIECSWIAPLVNDRPTSFFQSKHGLQQGCPLSPLLYILMKEILRRLELERTTSNLQGILIVKGVESIYHSRSADDKLLRQGWGGVLNHNCKGSKRS